MGQDHTTNTSEDQDHGVPGAFGYSRTDSGDGISVAKYSVPVKHHRNNRVSGGYGAKLIRDPRDVLWTSLGKKIRKGARV